MARKSSCRRGVSPVVAIMLLVAATVALTMGAYGLADDIFPEQADESAELASTTEDIEVASDGSVRVTGETTANNIILKDEWGYELGSLSEVGEVHNPTRYYSEVTVIAENEKGERTVIQKKSVDVGLDHTSVPHNTAPDPTNCDARYDGEDPFLIRNDYDLFCVDHVDAEEYVLVKNIDLSGTQYWGDDWNPLTLYEGEEFVGNGFNMMGVTVNEDPHNPAGIFAENHGMITNVGVDDGDIQGQGDVGALVGVNYGTIDDAEVTDTEVDGRVRVGGVVGTSDGTIEDSYSDEYTYVEGKNIVGGVVGMNDHDGDLDDETDSDAEIDPTAQPSGQIVGMDR